MMIVYNDDELRTYIKNATDIAPDRPILVDRFLENATEVDVDCISDGDTSVVGAIMEHIEQAGIHSGDSACVIPAFSLSDKIKNEILVGAKALAKELEVRGLMNIQFAVKDDELYVIEVNPRASRTVPFVSKSIGIPLAKLAAKIMVGKKLVDLGFTEETMPPCFCVKEAVFPWGRFPGIDIVLGPEMKSTGEVMGWDRSFAKAFLKAQMGAGVDLPTTGTIFVSIRDADKTPLMLEAATTLLGLGFTLTATRGTAQFFTDAGLACETVNKVYEGGLTIVDRLKDGHIALVFNTTEGNQAVEDSRDIRAVALYDKIPYFTTAAGAQAAAMAMAARVEGGVDVRSLQG